MIICGDKKLIEYKIITLDKNIYLLLYENNTFEIISNNLIFNIKTNKNGKKYIQHKNKIIFIDKWIENYKDINEEDWSSYN